MTVGEWAIQKGHSAAAFNRVRREQKRPTFRGDRHKGPDVRVVRAFKGWKVATAPNGQLRGEDFRVTEAEYDEAVRAAYEECGCGETGRN